MLGTLSSHAQQLATELTTGPLPVALCIIAIAIAGYMCFFLHRIPVMIFVAVFVGATLLGAASAIATALIS